MKHSHSEWTTNGAPSTHFVARPHMLHGMTLWVATRDGTRERVKLQGTDEEAELINLIIRSRQPYSYGWIELEGSGTGRRLVAYEAVERVELDPQG